MSQTKHQIKDLTELQQKIDKLTADLEATTALHAAARRELDDLRESTRQRQAVLGAGLLEAERRAEALREELARVYRSRSWRLTRPLRRNRSAPD